MEIHLVLCLPRDESSIPVVRHIGRHALAEIGVEPDCSSDIEVALTEACTNVLVHSGPTDVYEVHLGIEDDSCTIRVVDAGPGFDVGGLTGLPEDTSESGRGVVLMRALVDRVSFSADAAAGTVVRLEKSLDFAPGSPAHRLRTGRKSPRGPDPTYR